MPSLWLDALVWPGRDAGAPFDLTVPDGEVGVLRADADQAAALADVILGLTLPVSGSVRLDRRDVTGIAAGARGIALVPAGGGLLPHLNVWRNIAYGGDAAHAAERVHDLRLSGIQKRHPHELSPAQRLRVGVARALCHTRGPAVIVFEDRDGEATYHAAVDVALAHSATVLVITNRGD